MPTVTLDTTVAGGTAHSTSGLSYSHTLSGSATALTVAVSGYYTSGFTSYGYSSLTTHTVKVGTTPLVMLQIINCNNANGNGWVELWGLINPPTGAQTIAVVEEVSSSACYINVSSSSWIGVSQFGTSTVNSGSSSSLTSGAVVSATGDRVLSVQGVYDKALTLSGGGTSLYNQPTTATTDYVSMLVQDEVGAATVTLTSTTSSGAWGVVSVNLVAGTQWQVNAASSMTVSRSASASFVGLVWTVNAAVRSMTTTATATALVQPLGPALRYVGRHPDTTGTICTASYAQADVAAYLVTPAFITQQITLASANLVTQAWINGQVANYATQTQVNTALDPYLPTTALGSTVAEIGSNGAVSNGVLPAVTTNSLAVSYDVHSSAGTINLATGTSFVIGGSTPFVIATIAIPDPGYAWIPMPYAWVEGYSSGTPSGNNFSGTGNTGLFAVTPSGATAPVYGAGLGTDDSLPNFYPVVPCGVPGVTPATQPAIIGGLTLELSAANWTTTEYTVSGTGLVFFVLVVPAY